MRMEEGAEHMSLEMGNKEHWQKYPCITACGADIAVIAFSKTEGKLIDKAGRTIAEGKPIDIARGQDVHGIEVCEWTLPQYDWFLFWKAHYPEYLKEMNPIKSQLDDDEK